MEIMNVNNDKITSLEVLNQINLFRKQEGNRAELQHKTLLEIIRDEFEEEINEQKILPVDYKDKKGELRPMFELTLNQAKQVLLRESKFVRRAVINYIEKLENKLNLLVEKERELMQEKYTTKLLENNILFSEVEKLRAEKGDGSLYKSIDYINWWSSYFYIEKRDIKTKLTYELVKLSRELKISYDSIYILGQEILTFHINVYKEFRKRLEEDYERKILSRYRKW